MKKVNYLNNKDLLADVIQSKKNGKMSDQLAKKLIMLAERFATKPNYSGYTYVDDMVAHAMDQLCSSWDKFDEKRFDNAFAFYTQCIKNSFTQVLNKEAHQRDIRDAKLIEAGFEPSWNYIEPTEITQPKPDPEVQD
jgi:DNA-directed RNA polymerase specialized sigma subunit